MPIRKRGDRWQVRVALGSGRRIERTLPPGAKRADALALEARLAGQRIALATGQGSYTIDDAIDRWLTDAQALKSWARDLRYRIPILRQYTAGRPLAELPAVADKIKAKGLEAGLTPAAINRYVSVLRRVGNLAERWAWTDAPIGRRVVLLPENSQRHVYLTPEEVGRLAAAADPLLADVIWLAVLTGLRRSELLALKPDQLRGDVLILDARTKSGQPLTAIRDLLGHSSLSVTSRYSHLAPDHLRAAVAGLPGRVSHGSVPAGGRKRRQRASR